MKWIFGLFMVYLILGEPLLETRLFASFVKNKGGAWSRIKMYQKGFKRTWITAAVLVMLLIYNKIPFQALGFVPAHWSSVFDAPIWFKALIIAAFVAYFVYFYLFAVIMHWFSPKIKAKVVEKLLPFYPVLPSNPKERLWWTINSLSSFIEEFFYRGFLIFFLLLIFPEIGFWAAAVLSVLLDALRYIGRMKALVYVVYSSAFFVFFYGVFHSIYVPMIFHIIHDLRVLLMPIQAVHQRLQMKKGEGK
jgi:hypothetical protein